MALAAASAFGSHAVGAEGPWTLQQCIDYAMEHNIQLKQKEIAVAQGDVNVEAQKGALFPSLQFATNQNGSWRPWSQSFVDINNGTMTSTSSELNYNGTYGLSAQWTVWNGGRNQKNVEKAKASLEQARYDTQATSLSLQEQIVQCYVQILYQAEAVNVNRQIAESSRVQFERGKEMHEVGSMSRADLAQLEAQVSQDEYNVANAMTQLAEYKLQLKQILEIVDADDFEVAIPEIDDGGIMAPVPSRGEIYRKAESTRPEILYSQSGIKAADIDISIAKRGYWPTVSMTAGVNTSNTSGIGDSFANQIKKNLNNSVGLTVSVPIFDNKQNKTNVLRARLAKENSELELASAKKTLYSSIERFWLNTINAQQQYAAAKANVASMQESYDLVDEQFKVGLKDIVDLTTGKNNLIQAEQQMLQSKYTAVLNMALLRFYAGEPIKLL